MQWEDVKYGDDATPEQMNTVAHGVMAVESQIGNKVDKIAGKQLSTNDFNNSYRARLDNLDTELANKANANDVALKDDVLTKDNTKVFTPVSDYQPATKKYVDDNKGSGGPEGGVPTTRKINGYPLSSDVTLTASDVGAPSATIPMVFSIHNGGLRVTYDEG